MIKINVITNNTNWLRYIKSPSKYLDGKIKKLNVKVSVLARGIPVGDQLEYTDEVTLARSIQNRRPYETDLSNK